MRTVELVAGKGYRIINFAAPFASSCPDWLHILQPCVQPWLPLPIFHRCCISKSHNHREIGLHRRGEGIVAMAVCCSPTDTGQYLSSVCNQQSAVCSQDLLLRIAIADFRLPISSHIAHRKTKSHYCLLPTAYCLKISLCEFHLPPRASLQPVRGSVPSPLLLQQWRRCFLPSCGARCRCDIHRSID